MTNITESGIGYKIEDRANCAPEGTVFCSQIKLLEKIV